MPSRNKVEIIISAKDQASKDIKKAFGAIQDSGKKLAIGLGVVTAAAGAVTVGLSDLARESAASINVQNAFQGVVESSGKSMDEMLAALERGSAGMVDQTTLMKTYNSAAQLVGTTFANQLPDAMNMLGKVAAATGEDMGYMLDSLVRGVGRLSPMILDNLGIQVDLTKAYEDYAASVGKSVDELSKSEQQTALMNQVMELLAENTAAMPDIADSAAVKFAQFDAKLTNLKDTIGRAVIPFFVKLLDAIDPVLGLIEAFITGDLSQRTLDRIGLSEDHPIITFFLALQSAISAISAGVPIIDVLLDALSKMAERFRILGFDELATALETIWNLLYQVLRPIQEWINQNIKLEDVLIAVGIALSTFIIPALAGIVAGILSVLAPIALLVGAVALFRKIWEEDIGGVRTFVLEQLLPALDRLRVWFVEQALPQIQKTVEDVWNNVIVPAFEFLRDIWNMVAPALAAIADWFITSGLPLIGDVVNTVWNEIILPFFQFLRDAWTVVQPFLQEMYTWFTVEAWPVISKAIEDAWNNIFKPFFEWLGDIWEQVAPTLLALLNWFVTTGWPLIKQAVENFWHKILEPAIQFIMDIWAKIEPYVNAFKEGLGGVFTWLSERAEELFGFISDVVQAIQDLSDNINNSPLGDLAPLGMGGLGGFGTLVDTLGFQNGGIITQPTMGMIGENLGAGQFEAVLNSEQIRQLMMEARQGGSSIQINFNGSGGPTSTTEAEIMGHTIAGALTSQGALPK